MSVRKKANFHSSNVAGKIIEYFSPMTLGEACEKLCWGEEGMGTMEAVTKGLSRI